MRDLVVISVGIRIDQEFGLSTLGSSGIHLYHDNDDGRVIHMGPPAFSAARPKEQAAVLLHMYVLYCKRDKRSVCILISKFLLPYSWPWLFRIPLHVLKKRDKTCTIHVSIVPTMLKNC